MKPKLPSGHYYGTDKDGKRVCRGAMMGRPNTLPDNPNKAVKLHLVKLRWVDWDYDQKGAYWGRTEEDIYWASQGPVNAFVRAKTRGDAKKQMLELIPGAIFYR